MTKNQYPNQAPAEDLTDMFQSVMDGPKGPVALFARNSHSLQNDGTLSKTFTLSLDQIKAKIELAERLTVLRADVRQLKLGQLRAAAAALT